MPLSPVLVIKNKRYCQFKKKKCIDIIIIYSVHKQNKTMCGFVTHHFYILNKVCGCKNFQNQKQKQDQTAKILEVVKLTENMIFCNNFVVIFSMSNDHFQCVVLGLLLFALWSLVLGFENCQTQILFKIVMIIKKSRQYFCQINICFVQG